MIFSETPLKGAYIIDIEPSTDKRGFFARTWCRHEFEKHGLNSELAQCSISFNRQKGTLRGMHYQAKPYEEVKLVRCTLGSIYDVIIDLRPTSDSRLRWFAVELSEETHRMLYIPEGFAHGFQALKDNSEVFYQISEFYDARYVRGIRWNDPTFRIQWPLGNPILSDRDKSFSDFSPSQN